MTKFLKKTFRRLVKEEKGVTLVEYGIALVLAVTVGAGALSTLAGGVNTKMTAANTALKNP